MRPAAEAAKGDPRGKIELQAKESRILCRRRVTDASTGGAGADARLPFLRPARPALVMLNYQQR
ncbi:MAG: hypothetical protein ACKVYV_15880, partial [Limisphaerales bacterium]